MNKTKIIRPYYRVNINNVKLQYYLLTKKTYLEFIFSSSKSYDDHTFFDQLSASFLSDPRRSTRNYSDFS